mmetsp:Transcript_2750/g.6979  ORF Transcript_2750/g.6979 Transcript_2750/m.6979 type:complete len:236 (+) Transcript_2750:914-1621(+)
MGTAVALDDDDSSIDSPLLAAASTRRSEVRHSIRNAAMEDISSGTLNDMMTFEFDGDPFHFGSGDSGCIKLDADDDEMKTPSSSCGKGGASVRCNQRSMQSKTTCESKGACIGMAATHPSSFFAADTGDKSTSPERGISAYVSLLKGASRLASRCATSRESTTGGNDDESADVICSDDGWRRGLGDGVTIGGIEVVVPTGDAANDGVRGRFRVGVVKPSSDAASARGGEAAICRL